jgi:hypothetical protein
MIYMNGRCASRESCKVRPHENGSMCNKLILRRYLCFHSAVCPLASCMHARLSRSRLEYSGCVPMLPWIVICMHRVCLDCLLINIESGVKD